MDEASAIAEKLEAAFRTVETDRMEGVPILNRALKIEAVGMTAWQGDWLCVLIAPWFMNLVLLPSAASAASWPALNTGDTVRHALPGGVFPFITGEEKDVGPFHSCSLFSPVLEFADQETAVETAKAALAEIMSDAAADREAEPPKQVSRRSLFSLSASTAGDRP
jgi:[NiFe] hydrogenase assembly HybE family chaperone